MSIKDNYNNMKFTLNMQGELEYKIDSLTVMVNQLTSKNEDPNRQFKPKIYQGRGRGQSGNVYNTCSYDQQGYQNRYRSNNQYRQNRGRPRYYNRERCRSRSRGRYLDNSNRRRDRSSRSRSGSRASTNRDRIRCYKCREYDHFVKDCPTTKEERQVEQIQQMFNLDEEQMSLKMLARNDTYNFNHRNTLEQVRSEQLNL